MKKITVKEFFATIGCGLWQTVNWIIRLFGYKDNSRYGVFIRRVYAGSLAFISFALATILIIAAFMVCKKQYNKPMEDDDLSITYVSRHIYYHDKGDGNGSIYNIFTGEILIEKVAWISKPVDGDSLICFSDGVKRGYFSAFTGKIIIPAVYNKAWVFSDGVAAVEKNGAIIFIDHQGKQVFNKSFEFSYNADGYCFHNGYCIMPKSNFHWGIVNKKGGWSIPPVYTDLKRGRHGYWIVKDKELYGLYNDSMKMVLPCKYRYIDVEDNEILVENNDYSMQHLYFNLTVKDNFVCADVEPLTYSSDQLDKKGDAVMATATCKKYKIDDCYNDHYGLMDANGHPLTKPSYEDITAVGKDLYLCSVGTDGILINSRGHIVK